MKKTIIRVGVAAVLATLAGPAAGAGDVAERVAADCGVCHQLQGPADDSLEARRQRKGPPLFYAGNKFRRDWLENWLQNPIPIRPTGDFPPAHASQMPKGDIVDPASLTVHPILDAGAAKEAAAYLMTLKPHESLIAREDYTPGRVSERMGAMDFVKFKGCGACHKDTPKYGGVSGPELFTAWQRLEPAFITSYIRDPAAWEPRSVMPNKHLDSAAINKLADYLRTIGEKAEVAK